jgi:predicted choloylglycine hydrolase
MRVRDKDWLRSQLRITWHLPVLLGILAVGLVLVIRWNWLTSSRPTVARFDGSHYEIGLAEGRVYRDEIHKLFDGYLVKGLVEHEGWQLGDLLAVGRHYETLIPAPYLEEMRGIAAGSGLPYDRVLAMNTFPDAVLGAAPRACSAFAVRTSAGLLVGRNLDWTDFGVAHRYGIVQILQPREAHQVLSVSWPGMVGVVTGMNDRGLVVTLNMAYAIDLDPNSTPLLIRLRQILEQQSTIQGAVDALIGQPRTFAANVLVASAQEAGAVVVELSGRRDAIVKMTDGLIVTTNYFQKLGIRGGAGADRAATLRQCLRRTGSRTTTANAEAALADVCFRGPSVGMVTNQSVVFEPGRLIAWVALGKVPASSGRYYDVALVH